jgi:hypothetical protein
MTASVQRCSYGLRFVGALLNPKRDQSQVRESPTARLRARWDGVCAPGLYAFLDPTSSSAITLLMQLAAELRRIVAAFRPSFLQVSSKGIQLGPPGAVVHALEIPSSVHSVERSCG